jgi:hypothetical protein
MNKQRKFRRGDRFCYRGCPGPHGLGVVCHVVWVTKDGWPVLAFPNRRRFTVRPDSTDLAPVSACSPQEVDNE